MLSRILGNHSQILGLRELHYFGDLCDPAATIQLDNRALHRLAAMIFSRQAREVGARIRPNLSFPVRSRFATPWRVNSGPATASLPRPSPPSPRTQERHRL